MDKKDEWDDVEESKESGETNGPEESLEDERFEDSSGDDVSDEPSEGTGRTGTPYRRT